MCTCTPALATLNSIEFSPGGDAAGRWSYDGAGTLRFYQDIAVDSGLGSNYDTLVGATVCIPTLTVGEGPIGSWRVKPLDNSVLTIKGADGTVYLKATLNAGDLVPVGTTGVAYTGFTADLTGVTITAAGKALGSDVLKAITKMGTTTLDFALSLQSGTGTQYTTLADMLSGGFKGTGGFSGAITIPEPATLALLGLGSLALLKKRRQSAKL
ncbi:MAG: hypothetical protein A2Z25_08750 [Planctomycetes bacterium RBG_16_55_9]|nr:MAG: hypothetical protein A2Z25_08750 [Planctomycetes bacterium RBG_16_55_9]